MAHTQQIVRYPAIIRYGGESKEFLGFIKDFLKDNPISRAVLVTGGHTLHIFGHSVAEVLEDLSINTEIVVVSTSSSAEVEKVSLRARNSDAIISVGGGKVIDVGKMAAYRLKKPFVSVPTVLSNDGIASPIAVIDGISRFTAPPVAVYIPLDIVSNAPINHLRAGIGDIVSNISATLDWELSHHEKGEPIVDIAVLLARGGAFSVLGLSEDFVRPRHIVMIATGLIQSGLAMELAGSSRPASGAEHKISHAIDALFKHKVTSLHGEQTALGTLIAQFLRGDRLNELGQLYSRVNLPTDWNQIGLSDEEMAHVILHARFKIRPQRFTILDKSDISSVEDALKLLRDFREAVKKDGIL